MAKIDTDYQTAGANEDESHGGVARAAEVGRDIADDLAEMRTQFVALLAKLDADAGVTDTNYASLLTPAALKTTKG